MIVAAAALAALRRSRGWLLLSPRRLVFALLQLPLHCAMLLRQHPLVLRRGWSKLGLDLLRLSLRGLLVVARGPM